MEVTGENSRAAPILSGPSRWANEFRAEHDHDRPRRRHAVHFLGGAGWGAAALQPLPGDASTRRYARATLDRPQGDADGPAARRRDAGLPARRYGGTTPRAWIQRDRAARGRRCAGASLPTADFLRARGLSAPQIYAADTANGFALIEDLGDGLYADVLARWRRRKRALWRGHRCARAHSRRSRARDASCPTSHCTPMTKWRSSRKPI